MPRFDRNDEDVVVVIGSGAGGGTVAHELCRRGVRVVVLEAGPHHTPDDWVNDEWKAFAQMAWLDARTTSGSFRLAKDFPALPTWTCRTVGGTTTHWAGACPRFKEYEFRTRSTYGDVDGASLLDWPLTLAELEPWYERAEDKIGVTCTHGIPPMPANNNYKVFEAGARRAGYRDVSTGRYGTNPVPRDGRPGSNQDGFNFQGDKGRSKWSTLVAELPKAEATGRLDLRPECQAVRIEQNGNGLVSGVTYVDAEGNEQHQRARAVCVAGNAVESARLLLMSTSATSPDGLANSSGQVGRNYMRHMTGSVYGCFDQPVRMYRGETMAGIVTDEAEHDESRGFAGGYYLQTLSLGVPFMAAFIDPGAWGRGFTAKMDAYEHTAGMWLVGEDMPRATNRVTLNEDVKDQRGLPVPNVHFDDHENDVAMREHAYAAGESIYDALDAAMTYRVTPYPSTHNLGTCRMSERPEDGVVNRWGQAHDVPNLFVSDGSVFTTGAAANPTLTIVALAMRQADYLADELLAGSL